MATRYSKRQIDGSVEHYDSREEMEARNPSTSGSEIFEIIATSFNPFLAIVGFIIVGIAALWFASSIGSWPTWLRFIGVLCAAVIGGYVFGKLGNALLMLAIALIGIGIVYVIGTFVWQAL